MLGRTVFYLFLSISHLLNNRESKLFCLLCDAHARVCIDGV